VLGAKTHRTIYLVLLTLLGCTMVCSTWAANLMWVLLVANWVLERRWQEKWQMLKHSRALHVYLALWFLLAIGLLWSNNIGAGLQVMQVSLPLLAVPLVVLTTPAPEGRARRTILWLYSGTVAVIAVIATVRMLTIEDIPYREAVPYISHIRFALNCCMVFFIAAGTVLALCRDKKRTWATRLATVGAMAMAAWMLVFLLLLRSYTAMAVIFVASLAAILVYYRRWWTIGLWVLAAAVLVAAVGIEVMNYYRLVPLATAPLQARTANGNTYEHACDGIVENGNYVNNYVCPVELRTAWERRSAMPYDSCSATGYSVEPTLVRYLNAIGQTKDSAGVAALSDEQVSDIERGVANPVYTAGSPLRKMVYVMLFEREYYVHTSAVRGFTMLQRLELWRATAHVISDNPLLGVGTGDAFDAMHAQLETDQSELRKTSKRTHNQYLTLMAMFGVLGFAVVLGFGLHASWRRASTVTPLLLVWAVAVLLSFITEDTLDTLAGILFCTWFLAFRRRTALPVEQ